MLKNEIKNEKELYRELFVKAKDKLLQEIQDLKSNYTCKDCHKCCNAIAISNSDQKFISELNDTELENKLKFFENNFLNLSKEQLESELNQVNQTAFKKYFNSVNKNIPEAGFYKCNNFKNNTCSISEESFFCKDKSININSILYDDCNFENWKYEVKKLLASDTANQIHEMLIKIDKYREGFSCKMTGTCCRLSSSQFSYQELIEKANNGDSFAQQFISIFIPYESTEQAAKIYPEYVEMVLNTIGEDETVHFYHCPHIDDNNLCTIYNTEKRPQICKDFPNNPLTILYPGCGYYNWKKEVLSSALLCHALIEICSFLLDKMEIKN